MTRLFAAREVGWIADVAGGGLVIAQVIVCITAAATLNQNRWRGTPKFVDSARIPTC